MIQIFFRSRVQYFFTKTFFLLFFSFSLLQCRPAVLQKDFSVLQRILGADPISLNPLLSIDSYSNLINSHIYEPLLERDRETLEWKPWLAKDWNVSADKKTYTFYLRDDVFFTDGHPLTAHDVKFTFEKLMDPNTPNPSLKGYYQDVASVEIKNDYEIVFKMARINFLSLTSLADLQIIPKHIFANVENFVTDEHNLSNPIGTGPYIFEEWKQGYHLYLKQNPNYWGKPPTIKRIEYKILKNDSVALQLLKKEELDILSLRPFQWTRQTDSKKFHARFNKIKYLSRGFRYIGYNTRKFPFQDKRTRKAMAHALDLKKINKGILENLAEITTGNFWINSPQYNKALPMLEFNLTKAKQLLQEAGFRDSDNDGWLDQNGKKFSFDLLIPAGIEFYEKFSGVFKEELEKIGVDVNISQLEFSAILTKMQERDFDALMLAWSTPIESDPYQLWHSSQIAKGDNFTGFTTPEMDNIIINARMEFDDKKRNAMYKRFHEILYENQPYTFLFTSYALVAYHKRFENVHIYKGGLDIDRWKINYNFVPSE